MATIIDKTDNGMSARIVLLSAYELVDVPENELGFVDGSDAFYDIDNTPSNDDLLRYAADNPVPQCWYDEVPQSPPR